MPQAFDTFTDASTDLANYQLLDVALTPSVRTGTQFVRLFGLADGTAADEITVELALVVDGNRIGSWSATGTVLAVTGASSQKIVSFAFDEGSSSKFDLLGCDTVPIMQIDEANQTAPDSKAFWMVGVTAFGGTTDNLNLYAAYSGVL